MRSLTTLFVSYLAIFSFPGVSAIHRGKSLTKRVNHHISPASSSIFAKRQYHARRDLIDLCVSLDATILTTLLHIVDPLHADVHLCLCLQDLDIFLDTDVDALLIANIIGRERLRALLKIILNTSPHAQNCPLPPHAHRACVVGDPCAFLCDPNYIKVGNTCVCPRPLAECNGHCGNFSHGCPSTTPYHARAPNLILGPVTTLAQAQATCKNKETVCGIAGRENSLDYECIDIESTLDSCGGCVVRHPFAGNNRLATRGKDCGHIPGILAAECSNSRCVISQCQNGLTPNHNKTECIATPIREPRISRMRKERRRNDIFNVNAIVIIDSGLRVQLKDLIVLVVDLVADLAFVPHHTPGSTPGSPSPPNYVDLVNAIAHATANILGSPTIPSLITNINNLVHLTTLLNTELIGCGCVKDLGLQDLFSKLTEVINSIVAIQRWCGSHPVGAPTHLPSSHPGLGLPPLPSDLIGAVIIGLSDLLSEFGLDGSRKHDPSNGLGIGSLGSRSRRDDLDVPASLSAELLDQIKAIVVLTLTLQSSSDVFPVPGAPTIPDPNSPTPPINKSLIDAILQAVAQLLISTRISTLLGNVDALADVTALVASALGSCGCVEKLGLGGVVADVANILNAVLGLKRWCSDHPLLAPSPGQTPGIPPISSSPSTPGGTPHVGSGSILGLPINLGLGNLLASLGVNLDASVALQGLVEALITLIIKLQVDSNILPTPSPIPPTHPSSPLPPNPLDRSIVDAIVKLSGKLLLSRTVDDLLTTTDEILHVITILGDALASCECVESLGLEELVKDVKIITHNLLTIKRWCGNHPIQEPNHPNHGSEHVIINTGRLLGALGLDGLVKINGDLALGDGLKFLNNPVNGLLNGLGLGGARRWLGL